MIRQVSCYTVLLTMEEGSRKGVCSNSPSELSSPQSGWRISRRLILKYCLTWAITRLWIIGSLVAASKRVRVIFVNRLINQFVEQSVLYGEKNSIAHTKREIQTQNTEKNKLLKEIHKKRTNTQIIHRRSITQYSKQKIKKN